MQKYCFSLLNMQIYPNNFLNGMQKPTSQCRDNYYKLARSDAELIKELVLAAMITARIQLYQEPIRWSLHVPHKPLESISSQIDL